MSAFIETDLSSHVWLRQRGTGISSESFRSSKRGHLREPLAIKPPWACSIEHPSCSRTGQWRLSVVISSKRLLIRAENFEKPLPNIGRML